MAGTGRWLAPNTRNGLFRTFIVVLMGVAGCVVLAAALIDVSGTGRSVLRIGTLVLVGALASIAGAVVLARQMRPPIAALETSCAALEQAVEDRTRELSATAKILRVISSSPSDVQPVLDAVAESAARLCGARDALIMGVDGDTIHRIAHVGVITSASERRRVTRDTPTGRAILEARTIHVEDILDAFARDEYLEVRPLQQATGFRTVLVVPLMRDGRVIGALTIRRLDVHGFTPQQIALVETFADQAVIAIENVRLFKEVAVRNTALTEALDQQTTTAEILRVISGSPTDVQPVLDAVAKSATRICGATDAFIVRVEGSMIRRVAHFGPVPLMAPELRAIDGGSVTGHAIRECRTIHVADVLDTDAAQKYPESAALHRGTGVRTSLAVPLVRDGVAIGAVTIRRTEVVPFTDKQVALLETFADQAVIAIENVRLFKELQARNAALSEALSQQTATSEVLKVISSTPTDVAPVFSTILASATRLCDASFAVLFLYDGEALRVAAHQNASPQLIQHYESGTRVTPSMQGPARRAALLRDTVHIADMTTEPGLVPIVLREEDVRTVLAVPLLRDGVLAGVIAMWRREVRPFTDKQIELIKTFADQAVIAIENVRLFKELEARNAALTDALDQQTATSEILRVISSSPTELQPVLDTVAENAARVCGATDALIVRAEGGLVRRVAHVGTLAPVLAEARPISRLTISGRAMLEARTIHLADVTEPTVIEEFPEGSPAAAGGRWRTHLTVPLMRQGEAIGAITIRREEVRPFSDKQIALLQTFADQAVIAIENVRLFKELQTRNAALRESLDQQTATAEILRAISGSPTDVQPVFDTIVHSAARLLDGHSANVLRLVGGELHLAALTSTSEAADAASRATFPVPLSTAGVAGHVIDTRHPYIVADVETDPFVSDRLRITAPLRGFRSMLAVPMIHHDRPIGLITVTRRLPGAFSEDEISLLQTFADQAVIAVENVRLFKELQARNAALSEALEQQTATSEILRVISSSQTDVQPVFDAIAVNASRLCGGARAVVLRYDRGLIHRVAATGSSPALRHEMDRLYPRPADESSLVGRAIVRRAVVHSPDVMREPGLQTSSMAPLGIGAQLSVPMLHDRQPIGVIAVSRSQPGPFTDKQIELIKTFADQAVIAIENVRLFKELETRNAALSEALDQQTATAEILRVISSSPTNVQPVLEVVARSAARICAASDALIFQVEGGVIHRLAHVGSVPFILPGARPLEHGSVTAGAIRERRIVHVPDILDPEARRQYAESAATSPETGVRTLLAVPLMRDDVAVGAITIRRTEARPFSDKQIELLKTFADQAVIAIENVRLFNEIQQKTRELEAANRHKDEFLASMSHELRTPLNAVIGFSEVLLERMFGEVNAKQEEYLHDILASGRHLLSLINDILDLAKIEAGRMELELEDFDLAPAIDNAVVLVRERATRKGLSLDTRLDRDLGSLRGDQRKIKQILLNLLSNAVKFTPEGGRIEVRAMRLNGGVEISVTDTGIGIAAEDLDAVFEEFRQVGTDYAKKHEGTGLGLTLSRKFVELHRGRIWVKSQPGKGSTFAFTVPGKP